MNLSWEPETRNKQPKELGQTPRLPSRASGVDQKGTLVSGGGGSESGRQEPESWRNKIALAASSSPLGSLKPVQEVGGFLLEFIEKTAAWLHFPPPQRPILAVAQDRTML